MLAFLNQVRKPTLDLPLDVRRKMWFKPFMQSYLVVFIGYLTMYLIRKNFNIAQNDMISTYGLSMTQLGMIGWASPSPTAWARRWSLIMPTVKYQAVPAVYADPLRHLYAGL